MSLSQLPGLDTAYLLAQAPVAITDKAVIQLLLRIVTRGKLFLAVEGLQLILPTRLSGYQA
ncbi:hypothetical protein D3C76_1021670 [compost metagenome]